MFGQVLEYEAKDILRRGIAEGISKGKREGRQEAYYELIKDGMISIEKAAEKLNVSVEEIRNNMLAMN